MNIDHIQPHALEILKERYLLKDNKGNVIETPAEMLRRVADYIYSDEPQQADEIYDQMYNLKFLPNSPTLTGAGTPLKMLSACFVLPLFDNMDSVLQALTWTGKIHKSGGGTGFNFSELRPKGDLISSTKGPSSGPVSFMTIFNTMTEVIKQGSIRRGANMGLLDISHPDIIEFITSKISGVPLNNFNISVSIPNKFIEAVQQNKSWDLVFHDKIYNTVQAVDLFNIIIDCAWKTGDPGIVFIDTVNATNPFPDMKLNHVNPCSEQPLYTGMYESQLIAESCNLGSINLSKFIENNDFNWDDLKNTVRISIKFLDSIIDKNEYPFDFIDIGTKLTRKIGLGIMGLADALIMMGIPYDSPTATNFAKDVMNIIQSTAHKMSTELGTTLGTYPLANKINDSKRNNQLITIAPTGTLSIIAGCSSGIEPIYAPVYTRRTLDKEYSNIIHPLFEELLKKEGILSVQLIDKLSKKASIQDIEEIPIHIRRLLKVSHDISPLDHILMQAACQIFTDNAISKTINLPEHASRKDVETAFMAAYEKNCKSITIYRDNSLSEQVLYTGDNTEYNYSDLVEIPEDTVAKRMEYQSGCSEIYIKLLADVDNKFSECWIDSDGTGGCVSLLDSIAMILSICLRFTPKEQRTQLALKLSNHLKRIQCHSAMRNSHSNVKSCGHAIGLSLAKGYSSSDINDITDLDICSCGTKIQHLGKCTICPGCGDTKCN